MAEKLTGINTISPTYPVKPAQPVHKDRELAKRNKLPRKPTADSGEHGGTEDNDGDPEIDEYV